MDVSARVCVCMCVYTCVCIRVCARAGFYAAVAHAESVEMDELVKLSWVSGGTAAPRPHCSTLQATLTVHRVCVCLGGYVCVWVFLTQAFSSWLLSSRRMCSA